MAVTVVAGAVVVIVAVRVFPALTVVVCVAVVVCTTVAVRVIDFVAPQPATANATSSSAMLERQRYRAVLHRDLGFDEPKGVTTARRN